MLKTAMSPSPKILAALGALALLGGCGVGSLMGGNSNSSANLANTTASQADIAQATPSVLPAIARECPPIKIVNGGEVLAVYAGGAQGDPRALRYQAVINQESRNCTVSDGLITVDMGVTFRLIPGPRFEGGPVNIPIRYAVVRDELTVFSQQYTLPRTLANPGQSEEFPHVVEDVQIPYLGGEQIVFWVGFDSQG